MELLAPVDWRGHKAPPEVSHFRSLVFGQLGRDDQVEKRLLSGKSAGPFQLTSRLLPGLVRAIVYPVPVSRPSTELSKGEKLRFLSPWAYQKVAELDTADRTAKLVLTVGPRIPPSQDNLSAIRMELACASGQPEFAAVASQLGALARTSTKEQLQTQLKTLPRSELQTQFVQALLWRLESVTE